MSVHGSSTERAHRRHLARRISTQDRALVKRTSYLLTNPDACESLMTHAELERLRRFGSKYLNQPQSYSRRSVTTSSTPSSAFSIKSGSELFKRKERRGSGNATSTASSDPEWLKHLRMKARGLLRSTWFHRMLFIIILVDLAALASDYDSQHRETIVSVLDIVCSIFLLTEMVTKCVAHGVYGSRRAYFHRKHRIIHPLIVVAGIFSHLGGPNWRFLRGLKTVRCLTMSSGLRRIFKSLVQAIPFLANVATLSLFFLMGFSIFGFEAFSGVYDRQCVVNASIDTGGDYSTFLTAVPRKFCATKDTCDSAGQMCALLGPPSANVNFDSGLSAMYLVFLVVSQDGWVGDIMAPVVQVTGEWSVLYYAAIIATLVFLVVNLFVAVITTSFMTFASDGARSEIDESFSEALTAEAAEGIDEFDDASERESSVKSMYAADNSIYMKKMSPEQEEARVNLIMGATLAIEESMEMVRHTNRKCIPLPSDDTGGGETAVEGVNEKEQGNRGSLDAVAYSKLMVQAHQWSNYRNLTVDATMELLKGKQLDMLIDNNFKKMNRSSAEALLQLSNSGETTGKKSISLPTVRSAPTLRMKVGAALTADAAPEEKEEHVPMWLETIQTFVFSREFDNSITAAIVVNTLFLLIEYPGMSSTLALVLDITEYAFTTIFTIELVLRIIALRGLGTYLKSTERAFDFIVVCGSLVSLVFKNTEAASFEGLNSISTLRTLRVGRLMLMWDGTRKLIESVVKSSRGVIDVVVFMLLFQFVSSLIAMQLFGGQDHLTGSDGLTPRWGFSTFGDSFLTLLQVITADQWSSITYDAVDAANPNYLLVPFLIVVFIIGQHVLFNLFIAVILENFALSEEEAYQLQLEQIIAVPKELNIFEQVGENGVRAFGELDKIDNVGNIKLRMFLGLEQQLDKARFFNSTSSKRIITSEDLAQLSVSTPLEYFQLIWLKWRFRCRQVTMKVWFSRFVQLAILVSCCTLVLEDPHPDMSSFPPSESTIYALNIANRFVLATVFLEFVIKVSANGFGLDYLRVMIFHYDDRLSYVDKQEYLEDKWNQLDFVLLIIAIVDEIMEQLDAQTSITGLFRAGRVLRPLRLLNHNHEMKVILSAVAQSLPQVGNVFALCSIVYIIFGVVGRSMFAERFYSCNDNSVAYESECVGFFVQFPDGRWEINGMEGGGLLIPRVWSNARFSFDHIPAAFIALLELTSLKWLDKTHAAMDIPSTPDMQPVLNYSSYYAVFFILFVYIGALFVIRLFVGVLVEQFQRNNGTQMLTESQKIWVDLEKIVLLLQPLKRVPRPKDRICGALFDLTQRPSFDVTISVAILLNIAMLLLNPDSGSATSTSFKIIEVLFLVVFTIEAMIKCLALRHHYILSKAGAFELVILAGSLSAYVSSTNYRAIIQAGRVFRMMRVLRFVRLNQGVRTVFQTFYASLRPLGHIFFLMFLICFVFAVIGRQLFGGVREGKALSRFSNFRTFGSSFQLLFQIMAGDDWHLTMTDCMVSPPFCVSKSGDASDCGSSAGSVVFFVTYVLLVVFIFLNLFIAVVLENFRTCYLNSDRSAVSLQDFEAYRVVFQHFDIHNQNIFPLWQFGNFLEELPPSLRVNRRHDRTAFLELRAQIQAQYFNDAASARPTRPFFNELLRILCIHRLGIRSLPYEQQRDRVKQIFVNRAKVASMLVESVVRGYIHRRRMHRKLLANARRIQMWERKLERKTTTSDDVQEKIEGGVSTDDNAPDGDAPIQGTLLGASKDIHQKDEAVGTEDNGVADQLEKKMVDQEVQTDTEQVSSDKVSRRHCRHHQCKHDSHSQPHHHCKKKRKRDKRQEIDGFKPERRQKEESLSNLDTEPHSNSVQGVNLCEKRTQRRHLSPLSPKTSKYKVLPE